MAERFHEDIKRSVTKALTFRALVICTDLVIVYTLTKRIDITLAVLIFSNLASTLLYFLHERLWNRVHWGKKKKK